MIKKKLIDIPIYDQKLMLVDCDNAKQLRKLFKSTNYYADAKEAFKEDSDIYADTIKSSIKVKGKSLNCIYIVLNTKNNFSEIPISTLGHEAIHVMQFLYRIIGESFCNGANLEHDAYLLEYLLKAQLNFLGIKDKIKPKKKQNA